MEEAFLVWAGAVDTIHEYYGSQAIGEMRAKGVLQLVLQLAALKFSGFLVSSSVSDSDVSDAIEVMLWCRFLAVCSRFHTFNNMHHSLQSDSMPLPDL